MIQNYSVRIEYYRPSGSPTTVTYDIEAKSAAKARREGIARVKADPNRRVESIIKTYAVTRSPGSITASTGGPEHPNLQQVAKTKPLTPIVRAGARVTVDIPFTGTVEHVPGGKVAIVGDVVFPNGQRAKRTMPREYFEQLIGADLEPAPRRTTTSYYSIYPNDGFYKQPFGPVQSSSYPLSDLVQIKVVRDAETNELISKEFV